jgi:hypothetical protein
VSAEGDRFVKLSKKYLICKTSVLRSVHKGLEPGENGTGEWKLRYSSEYASQDLTGDFMWRVERCNRGNAARCL